MGKVPNATEILRKNLNRLSRVHEHQRQTDDRQTDRRQNVNVEFTFTKNESKHSEMGPVRQNPFQRTVRSVRVCALHCAQLLCTILHRTDLIISERELTFTFAICNRPSVVCLSVCNACAPYSGGSNFRQYFYGTRYLGYPLTSTENLTEIVPGEHLRWGS